MRWCVHSFLECPVIGVFKKEQTTYPTNSMGKGSDKTLWDLEQEDFWRIAGRRSSRVENESDAGAI